MGMLSIMKNNEQALLKTSKRHRNYRVEKCF